MTGLTSTSGSPGRQWLWAQQNKSAGGAGAATPIADADGDSDGSTSVSGSSPMVTALNPSTQQTAASSPLALLSNDLQSLLTSLQDVSNSGTSSSAGSPAAQLFGSIDSNSDGSISQSEWEAAAPQGVTTAQADQSFKSIDKNGDGSISQSELQAALKRGGGHHGGHHHDADAASSASASTTDLSKDLDALLQTLQQTGATTPSGVTPGSAVAAPNSVLNDQFSKMLTDLNSYLQSEGASTVQISA